MSDNGARDDVRSLWQGDAPEEVFRMSVHELQQVSRRRARRIGVVSVVLWPYSPMAW